VGACRLSPGDTRRRYAGASVRDPTGNRAQLRKGSREAEKGCPEPGAPSRSDHVVRGQRLRLLMAAVGAALTLAAHPSNAASIDAKVAATEAARCEFALVDAAQETGVPLRLLQKLASLESGLSSSRGMRYPWPWTLDTNGHGSFHFRSRNAAERHLRAMLAAGITNVDIGCMQVNWRWHRDAFASPADLLDPSLNVRYATHLLAAYKTQLGSWSAAVAQYHTRNSRVAAGYQCRVARALKPRGEIADCPERAP